MSNNTLKLSLIEKWFRMTEYLIKGEDYRNITPYWCNRFLLFNGNSMPKKWWYENFFKARSIQETIVLLQNEAVSFKKFDFNTMTLGYPSNSDTSRIITLEHKGIEIRNGNPEWGAEPDKLYFVIKHGAIIGITSIYKYELLK